MMFRREAQPKTHVTVFVQGAPLAVRSGDVVATALALHGLARLRDSPRAGAPRGAFCFMGACQECAIMIDGALQQACLTEVREGMAIELRGAP